MFHLSGTLSALNLNRISCFYQILYWKMWFILLQFMTLDNFLGYAVFPLRHLINHCSMVIVSRMYKYILNVPRIQ